MCVDPAGFVLTRACSNRELNASGPVMVTKATRFGSFVLMIEFACNLEGCQVVMGAVVLQPVEWIIKPLRSTGRTILGNTGSIGTCRLGKSLYLLRLRSFRRSGCSRRATRCKCRVDWRFQAFLLGRSVSFCLVQSRLLDRQRPIPFER